MEKKEIATGLGFLAMACAAAFGIAGAVKDRAENRQILNSYHRLEIERVSPKDSYESFAIRDRAKYPRLKRLSVEELTNFYASFNDNKFASARNEIYLPDWEYESESD